MDKPKGLILCTGNSCRSHMAEGILRAAAGDLLEVCSARSNPAGYVHPMAIEVLKEIGIDISQHQSKHLNEFISQEKWMVAGLHRGTICWSHGGSGNCECHVYRIRRKGRRCKRVRY